MNKFKRVLIITKYSALGGLFAGVVSFGKLSNEGPFIDIILCFLFASIIGLSFGMGSELLKDRGMLIKTVVRTLMRGLFCLVISLVLFGVLYIFGYILGSLGFLAFFIMIAIHILIALTLGISLGIEVTRKMPYVLRGIGGILGGIALILLADYIFSYTYDKSPFQVYLLGTFIGLSIAIGTIISERIKVTNK